MKLQSQPNLQPGHFSRKNLLPWRFIERGWFHRQLIFQLARQDILSRYKGSILGIVWSLVFPLLMLAVYTFVFQVIFTGRWQENGGEIEFALVLFSGLIVYNLFAESVGTACGLLINYRTFVTKVIFPIEILPWITLTNAIFHALVSSFVLALGLIWFQGGIHPTILLAPIAMIPLVFMTLGFMWILASLGVYFRDFGQLVGVLLVLLMFMSPIFYPLSAVPESLRPYMAINPLSTVLEQTRALVIYGTLPHISAFLVSFCAGTAIGWVGFSFFQWTRNGFADVI